MQPEVFDAFRDFIHVQTGLTMRRGKEALLRARISERMRALGLEDEAAYLKRVRSDTTGGELRVFINAITTNTTSFFRAPEHFDTLGEYARAWDAQGHTRMRVWCSASSTGLPIGEIAEAGSGIEALEVLGQSWIDLVVCDVHMPEMNGQELVETMALRDSLRDIPVVMVSSDTTDARRDALLRAGARDYLHKPLTPERLRESALAALYRES